MAGGGGDGDGRGGEGVYVVGVVGGGVGGGVAASASAVSAGWRRGASARGRIPAAGEAPPCRGDPTRGIEPRTPAAGCCRGGPPSGEKRAAPCQAAPHHGQPGQATAERAAQRRWPNGGVRPKAHTFDSRVMALKLPTSGTAPTLVPPPSLPPPPSSSSRTIRAHPIAAWSGSRLHDARVLATPSRNRGTGWRLRAPRRPLGPRLRLAPPRLRLEWASWAHPGLANDFAPLRNFHSHRRLRIYIGTNQVNNLGKPRVSKEPSKRFKLFLCHEKGLYGGLHFKSRALTKLFA